MKWEVTGINRKNYSFLFIFAGMLFVTSFLFNTPKEIVEGNIIILKSPANLITDYFKIANIGAALMNASFMVLISILLLLICRVTLNGSYIAAIFTIAGFSLFGKNIYNSIPIILGVYIYAKLHRYRFEKCLLPALFGTALGPLVSEITFNLNLPLYIGAPLGILAGVISGLILPPLAEHFKSFHKGFNLYNIGFTTGIIGTFFIGILRSFNVEVETVYLISKGNNEPFIYLLSFLFFFIFIWGLALNNWSLKGYWHLLNKSDVVNKDYLIFFGSGLTLINMSFLGIIAVLYVLMVGGQLSGPVIGGIFTVVGFGAYGKNLKNVIPIMLGVFLSSFFNLHDISSTTILLAALFGTTLAPVSQAYGPIAGIIAGAIHVSMVVNISYMHAGMNLYNNGFSGGFVAATLVPLIDAFISHGKRKIV